MIVVLKHGVEAAKREQLIDWLEGQGLTIHISEGEYQTVLGLVGDTTRVDMDLIGSLGIVDSVKRVTEPFKCCNRKFHPDDTVVDVGGVKIGGGNFVMIAGPCSVESEEQIVAVAKAVKASGANILRGGAFKPRTSPYDFQGLKATGLELLKIARQETGLPIVTEIMGVEHLPLFEDVDIIQVGARNMQNFDLLRELGKLRKPILLKRGLASTLKELLMSAEYIMAGGNEQVILCERGIRTFDDYTRNTLDLAAVPMLKELTHLPIIVDPSHATGIARLVEPDVDALAFGVERVGVGGQRDDFGLAIVADHGVVTGDRLMYIAEGNVGIGAFQPQRVPLARHAQNGVVGDGRCGEIARDMLVLRVDDGVERLDVAGGQHRVQVVGERLAVAEFIRIDRCGVHRLPASDAQLDTHVAGRASQIAVERLDFSPFVGDRVG